MTTPVCRKKKAAALLFFFTLLFVTSCIYDFGAYYSNSMLLVEI